jgi:ABC-type antimicrobial peptide transport system permease subunit
LVKSCRSVVGVVPDVHHSLIEDPRPQVYLPLAQAASGGGPRLPRVIVVRATPERMAEVAGIVRRTLDATLPNAELNVSTMTAALRPQFHPWRLGAFLFGLLGGLALTVAVVGLYGVIAYGVRRRTHELGVRIALGAQRARILNLVIREAAMLVAVSAAAGLLASLWLARFVRSMLYDTPSADPVVVGSVVIIMLGVGVAAALLPALRASRVDPMIALRAD